MDPYALDSVVSHVKVKFLALMADGLLLPAVPCIGHLLEN